MRGENLVSKLKSQFDKQGFVFVDNFITPEYAVRLKQEISGFSDGAMNTDGSIRVRQLLRSEEVAKLICGEKITKLATIFMKNPVLGSLSSNSVLPNSRGMGHHRDYPYFSMDTEITPSTMPILALQFIILLDNVYSDNAPTLFVPQSHTLRGWIDKKHFEKHSAPFLAPAGSLLVMHGAVFHGVAPNKSSESRTTLLAAFHPHWVRPFSSYLGISPENASEEMKHILGMDFKQRIRDDMEIIGYGMAKKEK